MQRWGSGLNEWLRRAVLIENIGRWITRIGLLSIAVGERSCICPQPHPKQSILTRLFLSTSISPSTMPTNHPFLKPFSSLKKAITRLRSRMPQSADIASNDLARPSSDPPILMTPSSTIHAVDIAMAVASKMPFNLPAPK